MGTPFIPYSGSFRGRNKREESCAVSSPGFRAFGASRIAPIGILSNRRFRRAQIKREETCAVSSPGIRGFEVSRIAPIGVLSNRPIPAAANKKRGGLCSLLSGLRGIEASRIAPIGARINDSEERRMAAPDACPNRRGAAKSRRTDVRDDATYTLRSDPQERSQGCSGSPSAESAT